MNLTQQLALFQRWLWDTAHHDDFLVVRDRLMDVWVIAEDNNGGFTAAHHPTGDYPKHRYNVDQAGTWFEHHYPFTVYYYPSSEAIA